MEAQGRCISVEGSGWQLPDAAETSSKIWALVIDSSNVTVMADLSKGCFQLGWRQEAGGGLRNEQNGKVADDMKERLVGGGEILFETNLSMFKN